MATLYILYSEKKEKFYIGSCLNLEKWLSDHLNKIYSNAYTSNTDDWELFHTMSELNYQQARSIESHIKKMKSKKYIQNLKDYPEIGERLRIKYKV